MIHRFGFRQRSDHAENKSLSVLQLEPATLLVAFVALSPYTVRPVSAIHHLQHPPVHLVNRQNSDLPLIVTNNCDEVIYPAILTQSGTGPPQSGFRLDPTASISQNVSADWRGRVWGRTNCTFDEDGNIPSSGQGRAACSSGDCGAFVQCQGAVSRRRTLLTPNFERLTHCRATLLLRWQSSHSPPLRYKLTTTSLW